MPAPDLAQGHVVGGRYTVVGVLGRGARRTAYEAVRAPSRQVVIKMYDPVLGPPALATLRASEAVTRDLPRALEVLEVGIDGGSGAPMVVTERSAKPSLAQLVQLCPMSPGEAVTLARNLARAVGAAHERGLAHLGIKPTNVFVGAAPTCDVHLADFGSMAAGAAPQGEAVDPLDVPWLAPEQVLGVAPPGTASDVFSAALVVFYALTGRSYWRTPSGSIDLADWCKQVWGSRVPASTRAAELGHPFAPPWDAPFASALDVDPSRRPRSMMELADAFARASRGEIDEPRSRLDPHASSAQDPHSSLSPLSSSVRDPAAPGPAPVPASLPAVASQPELQPILASLAFPQVPPPPRRSVAARSWWLVAGAAVLLLGAAAIVVAKHSLRAARAVPPAAPTASSAVAPVAAMATSAAAPAPSMAPAAEPASPMPPDAPSASAAPASAPHDDLPAAPHVVPPGRAVLVIACNPSCDSVWVDGHPAPDAMQGRAMFPGVHQVGANLAHHPSRIQPVVLKRGQVLTLNIDFRP
jgi:serine/threonine protein kinase